MKYSLIFLLLLVSSAKAATIAAVDCTRVAVSNAVESASVGDTIMIPAGSCDWTDGYNVTKAVFIVGAGVNNAGLIAESASYLQSTNLNETTLVDKVPTVNFDRAPLLNLVNTNYLYGMSLSSVRFKGDASQTFKGSGCLTVTTTGDISNGPPVLVQNCIFDNNHHRPGTIYGYSRIAYRNCVWLHQDSSGLAFNGGAPSSTNYGDIAWTSDIEWNSGNTGVYVQNCWFTNPVFTAATDGFRGAIYCWRFNKSYNMIPENHEGGSRTMPTRANAFYGNDITLGNGAIGCYLRSGGDSILASNTYHVFSGSIANLAVLINNRETDDFDPWHQAFGTNTNDVNSALLETATHDGGNNTLTFSDSSKHWTVNQWTKFHIHNTNSNRAGLIASSGESNITTVTPVFSTSQPLWTNGQVAKFYKVTNTWFSVGIGKGDLLTGGSSTVAPINSALGYEAWTRNVYAPFYYWGNTGVSEATVATDASSIRAGINYTNIANPTFAPPPVDLAWVQQFFGTNTTFTTGTKGPKIKGVRLSY